MATEEQIDEIKAFKKQVKKWEIPEDDELLKYLKAKLCSDLKESVELFQQCKSMVRLGSPQELSAKISSLEQPSFFYIGYTKEIDKTYLWDTSPKSVGWEKLCGEDKVPVKTRTYFTHLNEKDNITEDSLIRKWRWDEKCLNRTSGGIPDRDGIVYLLVYEYVYSREDVNRLCQKLKEGDMNDPAFREKIKKVKKVFGI